MVVSVGIKPSRVCRIVNTKKGYLGTSLLEIMMEFTCSSTWSILPSVSASSLFGQFQSLPDKSLLLALGKESQFHFLKLSQPFVASVVRM